MPYTVSQPLTKSDSMQIGLQIDNNTLKINGKGELSAAQGVVQGDSGAVVVTANSKVSLNADGETIVQDGNKNYKINIVPQVPMSVAV